MAPTERWELSQQELAAAYAVEGEWSLRSLVRVLARAPSLIPESILLAVRSCVRAVWGDVELAVLLDSERVRLALPGTVRGAAWSPTHTFFDALAPVLGPQLSALEIGCGVGRVSRVVAPEVKELVCTDISRVMVREARTNLARLDNVRVQRTSGYWLDGLEDSRFDLVFSHAVRRVLHPGGTSVIGFMTMDRPQWQVEAVETARRSARRGTFGARCVRPYTQEQVRAMHRAVGLEVLECGYGATTAEDHHPPLVVTAVASSRPPAGG